MKKIGLMILAGMLFITTATPVLAHEGSTEHNTTEHAEVAERESEVRDDSTEQMSNEVTAERKEEWRSDKRELQDRIKSYREQIQLKHEKMRSEMEAKRAERKSALADKRLATCQERQAKINELIAKSAAFGRERLTYIQKVEERVHEFYSREELSSSEYEAAAELVNQKEANAEAAIEFAESSTFNCTEADGDNPAGEIKSLHEAKRTALNEYRDSVKQIIQIVKSAYTSSNDSEGSAS